MNSKIIINLFFISLVIITGCKKTQACNKEETKIIIEIPESEEDIDSVNSIIYEEEKSKTLSNTKKIFNLNWNDILVPNIHIPFGRTEYRVPNNHSFYISNTENLLDVTFGNNDYKYKYYFYNGKIIKYYNSENNYGDGGYEWYFYDDCGRILYYLESYDEYGLKSAILNRKFEYFYDEQADQLIAYEIYKNNAVIEYCETKKDNIIQFKVCRSTSDLRIQKNESKNYRIIATAKLNENGTVSDIVIDDNNYNNDYKIEYFYSKNELISKQAFWKKKGANEYLPLYLYEFSENGRVCHFVSHFWLEQDNPIVIDNIEEILEIDERGNAIKINKKDLLTGKETILINSYNYLGR